MATAKPRKPKKAPSRLTGPAQATLRLGSHAAVLERLILLKRTFDSGRWLPRDNFYVKDTLRKLKVFAKKTTPPPTLREREMTAYVAVSAPLHCADGWSFLGRALSALMLGDPNAARHFAYYAELRAAMSLMASEGVGIFNQAHFVVVAINDCRHVPQNKPTHEFTWDCLDHWASSRQATQPLMDIVRPGNVAIREWLNHFIPGHAKSVAARWLKLWGIDLRSFPADREARNESSYRPTALRHKASLSVVERSDFVASLWELCEPSPPSRFENLDRFILRDTIREIYKITTDKDWDSDLPDFTRRCSTMINAIAPVGLVETWVSFLTGASSADRPLLLTEADTRGTDVSNPRHHLQVVGRAALLLRLATGASAELLKQSGASADMLRFWWERIGRDCGLWQEAGPPDDLTDLWTDVEEALTANREWLNTSSDTSVGAWTLSRATSLYTLGTCERIGLWGLGL
jgi:hypothetical protein